MMDTWDPGMNGWPTGFGYTQKNEGAPFWRRR